MLAELIEHAHIAKRVLTGDPRGGTVNGCSECLRLQRVHRHVGLGLDGLSYPALGQRESAVPQPRVVDGDLAVVAGDIGCPVVCNRHAAGESRQSLVAEPQHSRRVVVDAEFVQVCKTGGVSRFTPHERPGQVDAVAPDVHQPAAGVGGLVARITLQRFTGE